MMHILTSINSESQIDFDLMTLKIITYNDFLTNTIEGGKETFVYVVIQLLKDHINSLENKLKDKQKINNLNNLNKK